MQTLVIPLVVIVRRKFAERPAQVSLTDENDPVEAFLFDRTDQAFGVRVAIRREVRRLHDTNPLYSAINRSAPEDPSLSPPAHARSNSSAGAAF